MEFLMQMDVASKCGGKRLNGLSAASNPDPPLFTVVTVVFNGAKELELTILSVLNQSFANFEYIVIDGGSTDGTLGVLRKYDDLIDYWVSEPDRGVYDAFNKACQLITGGWTIFLGAGDVFHDTGVLALIAEVVLEVGVETEIVYGKVCLTNSGKIPVETLNSPWSQMRDRWRGGRPMLPHHQGVFHRQHILSVETPYDITYRIAADSKVLYRSIQRAQPVFADVIVTSASLGGVSTAPRYSIATANEVVRINREFGFTNYHHQLWFYLKAILKTVINRFGGETVSSLCIDEYRRLTGRECLRENKSDGTIP
jgi:glycosyltransferase involved in cell wall biosynthesis